MAGEEDAPTSADPAGGTAAEPAAPSLLQQLPVRLALILWVIYALHAWPSPPIEPTSGRQIALAQAFSHGRLRVEGAEQRLSGDFAYPDGPEGGGVAIFGFVPSLLGAPVCALVEAVVSDPDPFGWALFWESLLLIVFLNALPMAAAAGVLLILLRRLELPRSLLVAGLVGGSLFFSVAATLNPHGPAMLCACLALLQLLPEERTARAAFQGGLLTGLAVLCDFGLLLPFAIPVGIYGLARGTRETRIRFCLGAALPALVLFGWNWVSYGAPWKLPPAKGGIAEEVARGGIFVVGLPQPRLLLELLVGGQRGLFLFVPMVALGVVGLPALWRLRRDVALLVIAVAAMTLFQNAGMALGWQGGMSGGPRYMLPAVAVLSIPLCLGIQRYPRLGLALGGASVFFAWAIAQTAFYGTLRSNLEALLRFGPGLRGILTVGRMIDPDVGLKPLGDLSRLISPLLVLPVVGALLPRLLRVERPRAWAWGACAVWAVCILPYAVFSADGGLTPRDLRANELIRIAPDEPEPRKLVWYGNQLRYAQRPGAACQVYLRALELGGWAQEDARSGLREALAMLVRAGRGKEAARYLERARQLKPSGPSPPAPGSPAGAASSSGSG